MISSSIDKAKAATGTSFIVLVACPCYLLDSVCKMVLAHTFHALIATSISSTMSSRPRARFTSLSTETLRTQGVCFNNTKLWTATCVIMPRFSGELLQHAMDLVLAWLLAFEASLEAPPQVTAKPATVTHHALKCPTMASKVSSQDL